MSSAIAPELEGSSHVTGYLQQKLQDASQERLECVITAKAVTMFLLQWPPARDEGRVFFPFHFDIFEAMQGVHVEGPTMLKLWGVFS